MTEMLTKTDFLTKIFDFENEKEWNYKGDVPALIDFYADWCQPCKMIAPILEELSNEYDGKIKIYKIDTEVEQELAGIFGIRSIPSLLFIPKDGKPQMAQGALSKPQLVEAIENLFSEAEVPLK
ncbi:MAG: thioredoxin [Melioribacteraceae bacterium]|nr:thioredoxin [Melioribacteraceae bacterium]